MEDTEIKHRRSLRLKEYDYSSEGAYFVTICSQNRQCHFGKIENGEVILNEIGLMVQSAWHDLSQRFPTLELDEFVVMPNHAHGIIVLVGAPLVGAQSSGPNEINENRVGTRPTPTLGNVIGAFKSITTDQYIRGVKNNGWPPFTKMLWQRNYYEHIIRNESSLSKIRKYIINNPLQWEFDLENPYVEPNTDQKAKGRLAEKLFWEELKKT